jgi:hypothetical protein
LKPALFSELIISSSFGALQVAAIRSVAFFSDWALVLSLIMSVNLAMYLHTPDINFQLGLLYRLLAGVWVFCGIAIVGRQPGGEGSSLGGIAYLQSMNQRYYR